MDNGYAWSVIDQMAVLLPDNCRSTAGQLPDNFRSTAGQVALSSGNDSKVALG